MWSKINKLLSISNEYDEVSQDLLKSYVSSAKELESIDSMKRTEGWQIIEKKIREEIRLKIYEKVKDDSQIQSLLSLLIVTGTKEALKNLEEEVDKLLPE